MIYPSFAWFECEGDFLLTPTMSSARHGLVKLYGLEEKRFSHSNLLQLKGIDLNDNIFIGSVQSIRSILEINGIQPPEYLDYPPQLKKYLGRNISLIKKDKFFEDWESFRGWFIKPYKHKAFNGFVLEKMYQLNQLHSMRKDDDLWLSEPIEIQAEYRFYICKNKILSFSHYKGGPTILPNIETVLSMIKDWGEAAPASYSLDVGIDNNNKTRLIEVNDAFALGQYSFIPSIQSKMLLERWQEMVNKDGNSAN